MPYPSRSSEDHGGGKCARGPVARQQARTTVDDVTASVDTPPTSARGRVLTGATRVFHESGFHAASMSAIAAAAGITGPGLYRHYSGKNDLLATVISAGTSLVEAAFDEVDAHAYSPAASLRSVAAALSNLAVDHRHYGVIIQRDTRSLAAVERDRVRARWHELVERLSRHIIERSARYSTADAEVLARAAFAVAASPSYSRTARPFTTRHRELLEAMITTVLTGDRLAAAQPSSPPRRRDEALRDRASRREAIMSAATRLFGRYGFHNVSMDQIAELAGVTVPTVYSYFADKATVMATAMYRGTAWLELTVSHAVERSPAAGDRLSAILDSYSGFGLAYPDHITILVHEVQNLPAEYRSVAHQQQQDYLAEIVRPLQSYRPELDDHMRRSLVRGALAVVNELTRTPRYLGRPRLRGELAALAMDVCRAVPAS